MAKFTLAPSAFADVEEIWLFVSEKNGVAAERLIRNLTEKFELLSTNAQIGVSRDELMIGMRVFPYKSYNIYYFVAEDGIEIYRVLHGSRDIDSIFGEIA